MNIGLLAVDREKAKREAYKKLCYNFEYKFGSNIPHCALRSGVCDPMLMIFSLWFISCQMDLVYPETIILNGIKDFLKTKRV